MLRTNLDHGTERVALVTVTAPGSDVLPWVTVQQGVICPVEEEKVAGCKALGVPLRVDPAAAAMWNRTAAKRWSKLNRAARERLRRSGQPSPLLCYVWQLQKRGVLHVHLVLAFGHGEEAGAARLYVRALRELAPQYGFGYIDFREQGGRTGKSSVMPRRVAAGYLSRYATKGSQLSEAAALDERPRRLLYVSRRLTALSLCTMRRLRRVRFLWWIRNGRSRIILARAGQTPLWFRDRTEYAAVCALAQAP